MGKEKAPAFQFYPSDFLSDGNTIVMSAEEIGMYTLLLCVCWKEGSIPDDIDELSILTRTSSDKFEKSWEKRISKCFVKNDNGELVNPRLEKERIKQKNYKKKKQEAGKKGAQARWNNNDSKGNGKDIAVPQNENGSAKKVPLANDGSSSSFSSSEFNTHIPRGAARFSDDDEEGYKPIVLDPPKSAEQVINMGKMWTIPEEACRNYFELRSVDNFMRTDRNGNWKHIPNWHADLRHLFSKGGLDSSKKNNNKGRNGSRKGVNAEKIIADTEAMFNED